VVSITNSSVAVAEKTLVASL